MAQSRKHWLAGAVALTIGACAPAAQQQDYAFPAPDAGKTVVTVDNGYFGEMVIYLVNGGTRTRLGTVASLSTKDLVIPESLIGFADVQLQADPIGPEQGFTSGRLVISRGSNVELRLSNNLTLSSYSIW